MVDKESIINELLKFDNSSLELGNQIFDNRFEKLEFQIGFILPETFKELLKQYNGINLFGTVINGIDIIYGDSSLDRLYHNEHFEVENAMPMELFPFSADGRGNHYCFDLSQNNDKVLFWQHDFNYSDKSEIEVCNNSFLEWVKEVLIDWTLEDYNYDGSEK